MLLSSHDQKLSFPQKCNSMYFVKIWFAFEKCSILSCFVLLCPDLTCHVSCTFKSLACLEKKMLQKNDMHQISRSWTKFTFISLVYMHMSRII